MTKSHENVYLFVFIRVLSFVFSWLVSSLYLLEFFVFKIAISPCPNDIFNFFGLLTGKVSFAYPYKIETKPLHELNRACQEGSFDFIKASSTVYLLCQEKYKICSLGNSFATEKGPIILARKPYKLEELSDLTFAVAGKDTSAYLLLQTLFNSPKAVVKAFNKIIPSLQRGEVDAGVVIHEARVKASFYDLHEVCDLTKLWYERFKLPTPLGVFIAKKDLGSSLHEHFMMALFESIHYAKENFSEALEFCSQYSQEKDLSCLEEHIKNFSLNQDLFSEKIKLEAIKLFKRGHLEKVSPLA